jgi:hypothetical protein
LGNAPRAFDFSVHGNSSQLSISDQSERT